MKQKFTVLLLILAMGVSSCDKEDNLTILQSNQVRLSKILQYSNSTDFKLGGEIDYTYDNAGNMIKESFYDCHSTKILYTYKEYEYSGKKKIKEKIYDGEAGNLKLGSYTVYTYDGENLVKEENYRNDGLLFYSEIYEYDSANNLIREYTDDPVYGILFDVKYSYDNQSRLILEDYSAFGINDAKYIKHIFDNSGREIKVEYYDINWNLIQYSENIYDGNSKLSEKTVNYDKNGIKTAEYKHFYDKWGNLTETTNQNGCSYFKRIYNGDVLIEEIKYWTWDTGFNDCSESGMSRYEYEKIQRVD